MHVKIFNASIKLILVMIVAFQIIYASEVNAGVKERIGGSGGGSSQVSEGSSNSLIYIGAAVVAGLLIWKLVIDKDKKAPAETDSTEAMLLKPLLLEQESFVSEIKAAQEQIPVDIYLGFNSENPYLNERNFLVGVSFKF